MITDIRLHSMTLENFRGFTQVEIPFEQDLTVFIARNGGGKTSVLDAAAEGLRQWVGQFLSKDDLPPTQLSKRDIKYKTNSAKVTISLKVYFIYYWNEELLEDGFTEPRDDKKEAMFKIAFEITKDSPAVSEAIITTDMDSKNPDEDKLLLLKEMLKILRNEESLPVILYYRAETEDSYYNNGLPSTTNDEEESTITSLRIKALYKDALQTRRTGFKDFYHWFDQRSKYQLYSKEKGYIKKEEEDKQLAPVRAAIEQMLSDEKTTYKNLEIDYRRNIMSIEKQTTQETATLEVGQLSSGERHLFALVSQLALKLVRANPSSENPLAEGFGIVLLDELDAHLHPAWQRTVVTRLQKVFPKVQIIVTTHSPLVLSNVYSKHIRVLGEGHVYGASDTFGQNISDILEDNMDTKGAFDKEIKELFKLIDENDIDAARNLKNKLERKIEGERPEIIKASALIQRKELIGK